jgi:uncharacterized LabA/DUF88 family protein
MKEHSSAGEPQGFVKVMALINELIHDNRKQLQQIRRINERVNGQCLVSNNKLVNRERNFSTLLRYFRTRNQIGLSEQSEARNMQANRASQAKDYAAAQTRYNAAFSAKSAKWTSRVTELNNGLTQVNAALKAIAEWKPATKPAFIEEKIKASVNAYQKSFDFPLAYDPEMIQLAANDTKIRQRLYEWLNMLKASIINAIDLAQSSKREVTDSHGTMNTQLSQIIKLENADAVRLGASVNNWNVLLKNYSDNEKIYSALSLQTTNVLTANKLWCNTETANYNNNKGSMEAQLKVFVDLKEWLRKNYSRVRDWLRKKYNH